MGGKNGNDPFLCPFKIRPRWKCHVEFPFCAPHTHTHTHTHTYIHTHTTIMLNTTLTRYKTPEIHSNQFVKLTNVRVAGCKQYAPIMLMGAQTPVFCSAD